MSKIQAVHIPAEMKNLAINGAFDFWQRVEGVSTSVTNTSQSNYTADMIVTNTQGSTSKTYAIARSTNVPSQAQSGFNSTYSHQYTQTTGFAQDATDVVSPFQYRMEGLDYEKIHNKAVTFGFWINASIAGTYNFGIQGNATTRSYVTTFTINGANTWQFVPITVQMDSVAGYAFDNTAAIYVTVAGYSGSTQQTGTTGVWQTGSFYAATGSTAWTATSGATVNIAQFSILEGPLGLGATGFCRQGKSISQELALCERYYEKSIRQGIAPGSSGSNSNSDISYLNTGVASTGIKAVTVPYKVRKRTSPTAVTYDGTTTPTAGKVAEVSSAGSINQNNVTPTAVIATESALIVTHVTQAAGAGIFFGWTVDAGL